MADKRLFLPVILLTMPLVSVFSQEIGDFWVCPAGEASYYGASSPAYGGGFAFGYGKGTAIGLKAAFFASPEGTTTIELNFFFRLFFLGAEAASGPFLQIMGGPAIFAADAGSTAVPSELGTVSAGLGFGWGFILNNRWFIEPFVRAGYPYLIGAGVSAGMRF
jgi:hypothetical protein